MEEIRFGYKWSANKYVMMGLTLIILVGIASPRFWYVTDNPIYLLFPYGIYLFVQFVKYALQKRRFLIINDKGITLNYLLKRRKFASWDTIDSFKKKNQKGWTILYKKGADRTKEACTLFIPENYVAESSTVVDEALKRGFQKHIWHRKTFQSNFDFAKTDRSSIGIYVPFLIWITLNLFYFYLDHIWNPSNLGTIMGCTLVGGERFDTYQSLFYIGTLWVIIFIRFPLLPIHEFKGKRTIWFWRVLIAITTIVAIYTLPTKRKVYLNCSEPITNPIETIDAKFTGSGIRHGTWWEKKFSLTFEGKNYEFTCYKEAITLTDYYKGKPAIIKLQKGARGLPIVHELAIPEIGWSVNLREESTAKYSFPLISWRY